MEQTKTDLTKTDKAYYQASRQPELVMLSSYHYLTIQGQGAPDHLDFLTAVEAAYTVAYGIKFLAKAEDMDFVVPKMECQWWISGGPEDRELFLTAPRSEWRWKIHIRMPEMVHEDHFFRAVHFAKGKKPQMEELQRVKFEWIREGQCAQILHVGSYEQEKPSLDQIKALIDAEGLQVCSYHKEIYLNDPRKTEVSRLRTILRYCVKQPVLN